MDFFGAKAVEFTADLSAWDKLQLGWLDYEAVGYKQSKKLDLGPQEWNSDKAQGAVVVLPKKPVAESNGPAPTGTKQFWSGSGNNLENAMTTAIDLTGNEIRRLINVLLIRPTRSLTYRLRWSHWRRRHQHAPDEPTTPAASASISAGATATALR